MNRGLTVRIIAIAGGLLLAGLALVAVLAMATRRRTVKLVDLAPAWPAGHYARKHPVTLIVIHHSDTSSPTSTRRVLGQKGYSTHFEVGKDGQVYRYLDPAKRYALHAGKNWANEASIGIDITHVSKQAFTEAQIQAAADLVAELRAQFPAIPGGVAPDKVIFESLAQVPAGVGILRHRNVKPTACPENFPMERLG